MSKRDYYEILGVDKGADEKTMKSAFRKKAMGCHPDRHPDDPEAEARFKELNAVSYTHLTLPTILLV